MKSSTIDEKALISGLQEGGTQRRLFERKLYEHFFYLIKQGVWDYGLSEDTCASAYSDTVISAIENIVQHQFAGRSSLKSYIHQIFMNKCVDEMRKNTTNKNRINNEMIGFDLFITNLPDQARTIVQEIIDESDYFLLMQKIKELGEKCRELLLLFEDGYSDQEIAEQMQYNSAQVVKTTRLRCIEKLREKVLPKKSNG